MVTAGRSWMLGAEERAKLRAVKGLYPAVDHHPNAGL